MIKSNAGYLSKYQGSEVDAAVERVQSLDFDLSLKVDKTFEINGHTLENNFNISSADVGALSNLTKYGRSVECIDSVLYLKDQNGDILNSTIVSSGGTYYVFSGADGTHAGTSGLVPAPAATDNTKFLKGDGTWGTPASGVSAWGDITGTLSNQVDLQNALNEKASVTIRDWSN